MLISACTLSELETAARNYVINQIIIYSYLFRCLLKLIIITALVRQRDLVFMVLIIIGTSAGGGANGDCSYASRGVGDDFSTGGH